MCTLTLVLALARIHPPPLVTGALLRAMLPTVGAMTDQRNFNCVRCISPVLYAACCTVHLLRLEPTNARSIAHAVRVRAFVGAGELYRGQAAVKAAQLAAGEAKSDAADLSRQYLEVKKRGTPVRRHLGCTVEYLPRVPVVTEPARQAFGHGTVRCVGAQLVQQAAAVEQVI